MSLRNEESSLRAVCLSRYSRRAKYHQDSYGDSIPPTSNLIDEVYKDSIQGSKIKSLGSGWYLGLSVG